MIIEFLKDTYKVRHGLQKARPHIVCGDGFAMSVQAGKGLNCLPKVNLRSGKYDKVEVRYPSEPEELIKEYAKDNCCLTDTIYPYVPIETVDQIIEKHGGMAQIKEKSPVISLDNTQTEYKKSNVIYEELRKSIIDEVSQFLNDAGFEDASKAIDCKYEL